MHVLPLLLRLHQLFLVAHPDFLNLAFEVTVLDPHFGSFNVLLGELLLQAYVFFLELFHLLFECCSDVALILVCQARKGTVNRY